VYAGPVPQFALEAMRWVAHRRPAAVGVPARSVTLRTVDGEPVPVQADGDLIENRASWQFEIRPAVVRLIGKW
jgi:hypothetical protein